MSNCYTFAIGTYNNVPIELVLLGIPHPDRWSYKPYSRTEIAGDGTIRGLGFPLATWEWDTLTQTEIGRFLDFFGTGGASANVRIITPIDLGTKSQICRTFDCIMSRIVDGDGKTLISNTLARPVYSGVIVTFTRLIEVT